MGKTVLRSPELQVLALLLGIPLDRLFPLEIDEGEIHSAFEALQECETGMVAATGGMDEKNAQIDQCAFERAVVHLHHCAECLRKFPA